MNIKEFPISIRSIIENKPFISDKIGESDSNVLLFENMVLKIEKTGVQSNREYEAIKWLNGRLPVPQIVAFDGINNYNYLLMSRFKDRTILDDINLIEPKQVVEALADGIKQLWSIDIKNCHLDSRLSYKLAEAKYRIYNDLVDIGDFNEDTLGDDGFKSVDELYKFLCNNQPQEDLVFTHGDYCLPNIFIKDNKTVGYIDLGKAGIADRWQDLALCIRSLEYNLCNIKGLSHTDFIDLRNYLLSLLHTELDDNKLRYYILLDELF